MTMATSVSPAAPARPRQRLKVFLLTAHRSLAWVAAGALVMWGLSGMTHVVMASFGPQQATFLPPQRSLDLNDTKAIDVILAEAGIASAQALRLLVADGEHLLQVTEEQQQPRRYFSLQDGVERSEQDRRQAEFVARHFLGAQVADAPVADARFITEFDDSYPAVNRLLPVWRVEFTTRDRLTAYVYTETNALAAVDNDFKRPLQKVFQWFHTLSWIPVGGEWLRVILIGLLMTCLLAAAASGMAMIGLIRRRQRAPGLRGVHRIAGYVLSLPIFMFASSGLWHLLHGAANPADGHLLMSPPMPLDAVAFPLQEHWPEIGTGLPVNNLSIVQYDDDVFLYRLGLAAPRGEAPTSERTIRNARFDGVSPTGPALYVDARSGETWKDGDRELALRLGERFSGLSREHLEYVELVTRFGAGYDFRNKRLPVWRLDYGAPLHASLFIDTATGVQADRALARDRLERLSFTYLHKWNFLRPLGRDGQNLVIALVVLGSLGMMAGLGMRMAWQRHRRNI